MSDESTREIDRTPIRAWLLGRLPEAEAERLEGEIVASEETFETTRAVESELFDELARGRLTPSEKEAFLRRYPTPDARRRLAFASALAQRAESNLVRTARFRWTPWLAAAAVLVVAVAAVLMRPAAVAPDPQARIAEAPPAEEPLAPAEPIPPPAPIRRTIEATLVLGAMRGDRDSVPAIDMPPDAGSLRLRIEMHPEDVYEAYAVEISAADGAPVFARDDLASSEAGGTRAVVFEVDAADLTAGVYELKIEGLADGEWEPLGYETLRVRRASR